MTYTFTISEQDYIKSSLLNGELKKRTKVAHLVIDGLLVIAGLASYLNGNIVLAGGFIGAAVGGAVLPFLLRKVLAPLILKRHYKKYRQIQRPISAELTEDGIFHSTDSGSALLKWPDIFSWRENSEYILIYIAPRMYYILPVRLAKIGFPIKNLKDALITNVGAAV